MSPLAHRFTHAVQWNIVISIATIVAQVANTTILSRLLTPSDYGLFSIANIAFVVAAHLGDRGLLSALIREPVLDRDIIGSAISLSLCISVVLAVLCVVLAPLAAVGSTTADGDIVEGLIRLLCLSILISGISCTAQAIMQVELRFKEIAYMQLVATLLGSGVITIILALSGAGPWSLAFGNIANLGITCAWSWWKVRDRWTIAWYPAKMMRIAGVGMQMALLRILDLIWLSLPLVVAYAKLSPSNVGLYQRSQTIVDLGVQATSGGVSNVLFPFMASRQDRIEFLRRIIPTLIGTYFMFLLSVSAFVLVAAPDIVAVLLGPKWEAAASPLVLIMVAYTCLMTSQPASYLLEALVQFKPRIIGSGFGAVVLGAISLLLVGKYGLVGIAIAAIISGIIRSLINIVAIARYLSIPLRSILVWFVPGTAVASLMTATLFACDSLFVFQFNSPLVRVVTMVMIAFITFVAGFRLFIEESKRQAISNFLSPKMTRSAVLFAKILGLQMRAP